MKSSLSFGLEKCLKEFKITCSSYFEMQLWSTFFSSKWTKVVESNSLKMDQSCNFTRDHKFLSEMNQSCRSVQLEIEPKLQFDSWIFITCKIATLVDFETVRIYNFGPFQREKMWTKVSFAKLTQHVILNSFQHFSGQKFKTCCYWYHI